MSENGGERMVDKDGHQTVWGSWPAMPWKDGPMEANMTIFEEDEDDIDVLDTDPISWEDLEDEELEDIYGDDDYPRE